MWFVLFFRTTFRGWSVFHLDWWGWQSDDFWLVSIREQCTHFEACMLLFFVDGHILHSFCLILTAFLERGRDMVWLVHTATLCPPFPLPLMFLAKCLGLLTIVTIKIAIIVTIFSDLDLPFLYVAGLLLCCGVCSVWHCALQCQKCKGMSL